MTTNEAKKDVKTKLANLGVKFDRLTAKTISFADLARCAPVFVTIHGAVYPQTGVELKAAVLADVPNPSEGGYVVDFNNCQWNTAK